MALPVVLGDGFVEAVEQLHARRLRIGGKARLASEFQQKLADEIQHCGAHLIALFALHLRRRFKDGDEMLHQRKLLVVEMNVRRAMILKMKMIGIAETDLIEERPRH